MTKSEIEKYKEYVSGRLGQLSPFLQSYALGDFSETIEIADEEDEFTELLVALVLMVDDIKELIRERADAEGYKWRKVYFGGGEHFKNWLDQCRELGEVMVEEVDFTGYKCFEEGGEKLYRIWVKMDTGKENDL